MSLEAILAAIRETGQATVQEAERRAHLQARQILDNASLEAQSIREQARVTALEPASRERARLIQKARLDALQSVGEVREALVDTALEQCRGQLADFRANPVYPQVLRRLLQEALAELENCLAASESGRGICLEADPRDRDTIGVFLTELGLSLTVDYTLSTWGGLIARSEDGRVAVINTLEARLERATPYLRRSLAALFESDSQESVESRMLEAAGSKR